VISVVGLLQVVFIEVNLGVTQSSISCSARKFLLFYKGEQQSCLL